MVISTVDIKQLEIDHTLYNIYIYTVSVTVDQRDSYMDHFWYLWFRRTEKKDLAILTHCGDWSLNLYLFYIFLAIDNSNREICITRKTSQVIMRSISDPRGPSIAIERQFLLFFESLSLAAAGSNEREA